MDSEWAMSFIAVLVYWRTETLRKTSGPGPGDHVNAQRQFRKTGDAEPLQFPIREPASIHSMGIPGS